MLPTQKRYLYQTKDFILELLKDEVMDAQELIDLCHEQANEIKNEIAEKKKIYDQLTGQIQSILKKNAHKQSSKIKEFISNILKLSKNKKIPSEDTEARQMYVAELQAEQDNIRKEILVLESHLKQTQELIFEKCEPSILQYKDETTFSNFIELKELSKNQDMNRLF